MTKTMSNYGVGEPRLVYRLKGGCSNHGIVGQAGEMISSLEGALEIYHYPLYKPHTSGLLIVSNWTLPLMHHVTPVLLTPRGVLVFFDVDRQCKVAITLPYDIEEVEFNHFIAVLSSLSLLVMDDKLTDRNSIKSTGEVIAYGLDKASQVISSGIGIGATKLSELVNATTKYYCQNTTPTNTEISVNPNVKSSLEYARRGSHCLVQISGKAFGILLKSTQYLASKAAPHVKSAADNVIPIDWKKSGANGEKSTVDQIAIVTGATIHGFSQLCSSLHDGAILFGRNFTRDSSNVMRHCYGTEMGHLTEHALYSAGNIGLTAFTAMTFTKKGIIKTAAQITASEVAREYKEKNSESVKRSWIDE